MPYPKFHNQNGVDRPTLHTHRELRGMHGDYYRREVVIQNNEIIDTLVAAAASLATLVALATVPVEVPPTEDPPVEDPTPPTSPAPAS